MAEHPEMRDVGQSADKPKFDAMREKVVHLRGQLLHSLENLHDTAFTEEHQEDLRRKSIIHGTVITPHHECMSKWRGKYEEEKSSPAASPRPSPPGSSRRVSSRAPSPAASPELPVQHHSE